MQIGKRIFKKDHTYIMGILNVTPDSFSDGGNYNTLDKALFQAEQLIQEGADIIDIGGESTRPNYTLISEEEEIERVIPVIRKIKSTFNILISIDTYKGNVAKQSIEAGADLVNDIWGLKYDKEMASIIAKQNCSVCIMHNRKVEENPYKDFKQDIINDLQDSIQLAKEAGIKKENIIIDPGIGFGKTYEQNLQCIQNLEWFHQLGYPVLLGVSRKSVIGLTLDLPVTQREEGTIATTILAAQAGCGFVRVHDVKKNKRAIRMIEKIKECEIWYGEKR